MKFDRRAGSFSKGGRGMGTRLFHPRLGPRNNRVHTQAVDTRTNCHVSRWPPVFPVLFPENTLAGEFVPAWRASSTSTWFIGGVTRRFPSSFCFRCELLPEVLSIRITYEVIGNRSGQGEQSFPRLSNVLSFFSNLSILLSLTNRISIFAILGLRRIRATFSMKFNER